MTKRKGRNGDKFIYGIANIIASFLLSLMATLSAPSLLAAWFFIVSVVTCVGGFFMCFSAANKAFGPEE